MNRNDLINLSRTRLHEARALLKSGHYSGSYYLCGYIIECGLKACIAKNTKKYDFPDKNIVKKSYSHDLEKLVRIAGLELDLNNEIKKDQTFGINWAVVKDWSENSRYRMYDKKSAQDIYSAIVNRNHGVLKWIKQHW